MKMVNLVELNTKDLQEIKEAWGVEPYAEDEEHSDDITSEEEFWRQAASLDKYLRENRAKKN